MDLQDYRCYSSNNYLPYSPSGLCLFRLWFFNFTSVDYYNYEIFRPSVDLDPEQKVLSTTSTPYISTTKNIGVASSGSESSSTFTDLNNMDGGVRFQGRNKAAIVNNLGIPSNMTAIGAFDYVVSVSLNISNDYSDNTQIQNFCSKISSSGFSADVAYEPIYEILFDTKVFGLYLSISNCGSTSAPYDKYVNIGFKLDSSAFVGSSASVTLSSKTFFIQPRPISTLSSWSSICTKPCFLTT